MNILITGVAGSGKTTIAAELNRRGYDAVNMDSVPGLCSWVNLATGVSEPGLKIDSADDWAGKYDWMWDRERLIELLKEKDRTYFCGSSGNQERYYKAFDRAVLLEIDEQLIRDRVLGGDRGHAYGQKPGEVDAILGYYEAFQDHAKAAGAIVINARRPLAAIVGQILEQTNPR